MVIAPLDSVGKCIVVAWCVVGWHGMGRVGLVLRNIRFFWPYIHDIWPLDLIQNP